MFKKVTLEMSLKPFKQTCEQYIRKVCNQVFAQWRPVIKDRECISILLWIGDGSEILDYNRDFDQEFEWGYFIGTANLPLANKDDDPALSLHTKKRLYIENPPKMSYGVIKRIVRILKEEGKILYPNSTIKVGCTFDIGPEFALSEFKYNRHPEICSGTSLDQKRFVDCTALLNSDNRAYAAFPSGITNGLPFATFLGKQTNIYCSDMGFDYVWLSNGLGFSADPWKMTGKIYDGETFHADRLRNTAEKVFLFWKLFREACPDIPVETRGTNNSAGIDYATDGVPLWGIYHSEFGILPPPNSPWAAINDNYGLEIMGHMTRICELPENKYMFRYYIHDPWWMNSPWYDRYDGCASDIYLPMSVSRIDKNGKAQPANVLNVFTIDNSRGEMPDSCVNEPVPHILKAEKDCPDEMAFLIWLYPMKEYTNSSVEKDLSEMFSGDRFIMECINNGFPLNTVVSTTEFRNLSCELFKGRIIVSPCIRNNELIKKLQLFANDGVNLILYGCAEHLADYPIEGMNVTKIDISDNPTKMRQTLSKYGYNICFETKEESVKLPTVTICRSNNASFFSVYSPNTTTDTLLRFPLGAPILLGGEMEISDGYAKYRFSRCEHRECRVFIEQKEGIIYAHEAAPVSFKYRRRFYINGLKDATVYYFPEKYCDNYVAVTKSVADKTPELDDDWIPFYDTVMGWGFKGENKNGRLYFLMPFESYLE